MDIEDFVMYCLAKPGTEETLPFDNETLVMKVKGKMFALGNIHNFISLNLKCAPDRAIELRAEYDAIEPGFHMNKKHWNTVYFGRDMKSSEIKELIDHSYELVVQGLTKKLKEELKKES